MTTNRRQGINRRESLRRVGLMAVATGMPFSFSASAEATATPWQMLDLTPINGPGYGTDPNLIHPEPAPWPKTLSEAQLELVSSLADILLPAEGELPAASAVGVPEVIDEWISAPYPMQQGHRVLLLSGLAWCDRESHRRFANPFTAADVPSQLAIIEDIAYPIQPDQPKQQGLEGPRQFFSGLRQLVTGAYYTSPAGVRELGYLGNVAIAGDYPGPTKEAMAHLEKMAADLGLIL